MAKSHSSSGSPAVLKPGSLPDPSTIASPPDNTPPLDAATRRSLLKIPDDQRAEVDEAMQELFAKRAQIATDLGTLAPDVDQGNLLFQRYLLAYAVNAKLQLLLAYVDDQNFLASDALMVYLNQLIADIEHLAARNPQIADRYPKILRVREQRSEAIAAGRARAKAVNQSKNGDTHPAETTQEAAKK